MTESEARAALEGILDQMGVTAGDCVMLGVDMSKLPLPRYSAALSREAFREREQKWCQFVLDVLLDRLTASGTLLFPSFTYTCSKAGSIFIAEDTPSEVGPFTEFARSQPQAVRSLHPIFSVSGIGRDAKDILGNVGRSAFGAMSPFSRFASHRVRFLCLGVELRRSVTYVHHLEQVYGCPHRYNKTFDTSVISGGCKVSGDWYAYMAFRGISYTSDISSLQHALKACGSLVEAEWNGQPNHLAEIADVDRVGLELLTEDSCAFVNRHFRLHFDDSVAVGTENDDSTSLAITAAENISPA